MMSLLLKISEVDFDPAQTSVSLKQSDRDFDASDLGRTVYVWFTDAPNDLSHLAGRGRLAGIDRAPVPQKGDPTKFTSGYVVSVEHFSGDVARHLTTDMLVPFRGDPDTSPMHILGKLHANRNERLVRLPAETEAVLAARF
jgi:hypothetical protein